MLDYLFSFAGHWMIARIHWSRLLSVVSPHCLSESQTRYCWINVKLLNGRSLHREKHVNYSLLIICKLQPVNYINKPVSGCVRMACDSLWTTSLLEVVDCKLIVKNCYLQAWCKLCQLSTSCNKSANDKLQHVWF